MAKKVVAKRTKSTGLDKMSFSDLYAMYMFVLRDADKVFGHTAPTARIIVLEKEKELASELYKRVYGENPFASNNFTIEGSKPEDVNLDRFVVAKSEPKEDKESESAEDAPTKTFVVVRNTESQKEG